MSASSNNQHTPLNLLNASINRRTFLQKLAISTSSVALYGCGGGSSGTEAPVVVSPPPTGDIPGQVLQSGRPIQSIVIIGAGMSGLIAGYELSQVGHTIIFLEARDRVGGRVNTILSPFSDGQFAEAGASRIPSNHTATRDYVSHFGLSLEQFYPTTDDYFQLTNNQVQRIGASSHIAQPPWAGSVNRSEYSKIVGGMSSLPNALRDILLSNIHFSSPASLVQQDNNGVTVTSSTGEMFVADRVLCTTPIPVLGNIQFDPVLSSNKQLAMNGDYDYTESSRLYTQFSEQFWRDNNFNGWGDTDLPEEIWSPTWNQPGSTGIIQSYLRGVPAIVFDSLTPSQQISSVHNRMRQVFPNLDDFILTNHVYAWADEVWTGSGYASPTSSQEALLKTSLSTTEGRIHFAGEHASEYPGWIQGAIESGIRAAKEIHQSA